MDYMIEMKKETDSKLPFANVPLGSVTNAKVLRESQEKEIRLMVKDFLKKSEYKANSERWSLNEEETIVVKANPRVNSWKNSFEGKIYEGEFKIPEKRRKQFNEDVRKK